jgi:hypothetical protein
MDRATFPLDDFTTEPFEPFVSWCAEWSKSRIQDSGKLKLNSKAFTVEIQLSGISEYTPKIFSLNKPAFQKYLNMRSLYS